MRGVIFFYATGTLGQTFPMWDGLLNVTEYQGQHLIGESVFPPSVGKCQEDKASVCHPAAHSSTSLMGLVSQLAEQDGQEFPLGEKLLCHDASHM